MRILHLTDTHLGIVRATRGGAFGWSRADDHVASMKRALEPVLHGEVDVVVHSGDLFDRSSPPAKAIVEATELLARVGRAVPVIVIPGNHDRYGLLRSFPTVPRGVTICDQPARVEVGDVALGFVPFRRTPADWRPAAREAVGAGVDLLFAHQAFDGVRVPGLVFRPGLQSETLGEADVPDGVGVIGCGHLHPRQQVRVGGATVVVPGSTERTSWSEHRETKGYTVWEFERTLRWVHVDLPARPMRWVDGPRALRDVDAGDWVRVSVDDPDALVELERDALARGAILDGAPHPEPVAPDPRQLSIFGA